MRSEVGPWGAAGLPGRPGPGGAGGGGRAGRDRAGRGGGARRVPDHLPDLGHGGAGGGRPPRVRVRAAAQARVAVPRPAPVGGPGDPADRGRGPGRGLDGGVVHGAGARGADPGRDGRGRAGRRPHPRAGRPGRGAAAGPGGGAAAPADPGRPADLPGRRRRPGRRGDRGAAQRPGRPGVHPRTRGRGPVRRAQPRGRAGRAGRHGPGGALVAGDRPAAGGRGRAGAVAGGDGGGRRPHDPGDAAGRARLPVQPVRAHPGPGPPGQDPGRGAASRERILEVLDSGEVVPEAPDPVPAAPPRRGLALRGVWFAYAEGAPVLRHLDLKVAAGERVCVVGPTGAGKSTLLALLLRFYDPEAGAVELDGVDLRRLELASLRRQIALVPQDPWMLDGTIADNLTFGRPGATPEALEAAARTTLLDDVIDHFPGGGDTQVGEGGVRLSGGQRRRVALARAILRDASVLLLDEPTSGLDAASEQAVLDALDRAAAGRTVVAVSHRLGLAARADRVVVLDGGRVAEQGPPAELLAAGGAYARLWALQRPHEPALTGVSGEGVNS